MYWILDVVVLLLLALTVFCSIKAGITGMTGGFLGIVIHIALFFVMSAGFVFLFHVFGIIDAFAAMLANVIGTTAIVTEFFPMEYIYDGFAIFALAVISFILSYIIVTLLFKAIGSLFTKKPVIGGVNKTIGCIVGVCLYVGVVACVFGCIHAFADAGSLQAADEVLRANVVSGFVYRVNPLNGVFNDLGFAPKLLDILHGNF